MDKIVVINFGSQYNELIVRRIRSLKVFALLLNPSQLDLKDKEIKGIILSGGPFSVNEKNALMINEEIFNLNVPILSICYGMQLINKMLGGQVETSLNKEFGKTEIKIIEDSPLSKDLPFTFNVWMSHNDVVTRIADNFNILAISNTNKIAMIKHLEKDIYGVQFHPEVDNTEYGLQILDNFIEICQIKREYDMPNFIKTKIKEIKDIVQDKKVICALSGGVDSSVVALLLDRAIPNQFIGVFINHGFLRKDEEIEVSNLYKNILKTPITIINAEDEFLNALKGVIDPEEKRKIIGKTFISEFQKVSEKYLVDFLAQGTLYTDIIESGYNSAKTIKSHHNVGGLPKDLNFTLIEPLKTLFKDEVRLLGKELGLPETIYNRQPFPGPGLAIRIIGEINKNDLLALKEAHQILDEEIKKDNLQFSIWQYFIVLTPIRTVGVMGDSRTYGKVAIIRAVTSKDGMTADYFKFPYATLERISLRLVNEVKGITRVVYDITSKPPSTIEWE